MPTRTQVREVHDRLLAAYGAQQWWPADSPFEVMVGAVLTQNTAWSNVVRAIANIKAETPLDPARLLALGEEVLARQVRSAGYYNLKARRLINLCRFLEQSGGEGVLCSVSTDQLRTALLQVNGIGPETADDILLYAFDRPVFVIDAYTRRIFSRLGLIAGDEPYDLLKQLFEQALNRQTGLSKELHALIVQHAKARCRSRPRCQPCCLADICPSRVTE